MTTRLHARRAYPGAWHQAAAVPAVEDEASALKNPWVQVAYQKMVKLKKKVKQREKLVAVVRDPPPSLRLLRRPVCHRSDLIYVVHVLSVVCDGSACSLT